MKKVLSLFLSVLMLFAAIPTVFAEAPEIVSISAEYISPLIENVSGEIYTDSLGREFFMYDVYDSGLLLTVEYSDGDVITAPWYEFYDEVTIRDGQGYNNQWTVGEYSVTVYCGNKKTTATVTIIENPYDYIEAYMQRPLIEYVDGYEDIDWDSWDYETSFENTFFRYSVESDEILYITVYMKDGTVIEGSASEIFEATGYPVEVFDDQSYYNQWGIGTHYATVEFVGLSTEVEVSIIENDLESVTIDPVVELTEGVDCIWIPIFDYETWEATGKYPYYNIEDYLNVTVTYDDGYTVECKASELAEMTGCSMELTDYQSEYSYWTAGTYEVIGTYMGTQVEFTVNIVENPYTAISVSETENKELLLTFTEKDGGTLHCTAQKIIKEADLLSAMLGDGAVTATLVTDKGDYKVRINSGEDIGDNVMISYGALESNTLTSCDWLRATEASYSFASATVLYQIMSTVYAPITFHSFSAANADKCIDYISSVCALKYLSELSDFLDAPLDELVTVSEDDDMLMSVIIDENELAAISADMFGTEFNFTLCSGYDSETGKVHIPLLYLPLILDASVTELLNVGEGAMDSCTFDNGEWTSTVEYLYVDDNGALQATTMVITLSEDLKLLSLDTGIHLRGDIDNDGAVNLKDSNLIKNIISGIYTPDEYAFAAADINGDGTVNTKDAYLMKKLIVSAE